MIIWGWKPTCLFAVIRGQTAVVTMNRRRAGKFSQSFTADECQITAVKQLNVFLCLKQVPVTSRHPQHAFSSLQHVAKDMWTHVAPLGHFRASGTSTFVSAVCVCSFPVSHEAAPYRNAFNSFGVKELD